MLTFFEYLKQRAYESILEGAQEAFDYLEAKNCSSSSTADVTLTKTLEAMDSQPGLEKQQNVNNPSHVKPDASGSEQPLPPPRRRGRPPKNDRSGK